jgi:hypothetical protein
VFFKVWLEAPYIERLHHALGRCSAYYLSDTRLEDNVRRALPRHDFAITHLVGEFHKLLDAMQTKEHVRRLAAFALLGFEGGNKPIGESDRIVFEVGIFIPSIVEGRPTTEVFVITVVVVETAIRTVEVPRVVGIVIGRRTPLLAYVVLTTHVLNS